MLDVSAKLFRDMQERLDVIGGLGEDVSLIKAVCAEYIIVKVFADFERCLKRDIVYKYLANNRDYAMVLLSDDSHKMPKDLNKFVRKMVELGVVSDECAHAVTSVSALRNDQIAHRAALGSNIAWENVAGYITGLRTFLESVDAYLGAV